MDDLPVTDDPPPFDGELRRLSPAVRWAWLGGGVIGATVTGALLLAGDFAWASRQDWWPAPPGLVGGLLAVGNVVRALVHPFLRWPRFRYAVGERDLSVQDGVLWRTWSTVPRSRVQHVEVNAGPIDRLLGIATLEVFTAGTGSADLEIPGLAARAAAEVRDALLRTDDDDEEDAALAAAATVDLATVDEAAGFAPAAPPPSPADTDLTQGEVPAAPFPEPPAPESGPPPFPRGPDA